MSAKSKKVEEQEVAKATEPVSKVADVKAEPAAEAVEAKAKTAAEAATEESQQFAKAGKRSKKVIEEEKAETERQERKTERKAKEESGETEEKKGPKPFARPKLLRRGKKYQEAAKKLEKNKTYALAEALKLATETSPVKFDSTVEIHARLNVDPRQADQNIRATVSLPNGSGKKIRVAAFVPEDQAKVTKDAGADIAGEDEIAKMLAAEKIDFDVLIATPAMMPKLGKFARFLGPKGLMPNPKAGTVTPNVAEAVKESKAGKVEYRVDKQSIVHLGIGKVSFGAEKLLANADAFISSLKSQKPASVKGVFVRSLSISTTMGPGIRVENTLN